ncbi:hypothetical protein EVA_11541 [gut metagenome]|uniref:Uncharacterized protein n=1 Tax=gut metagenome TaxID=749906 RepID=J9FZE3_9ZZZZ
MNTVKRSFCNHVPNNFYCVMTNNADIFQLHFVNAFC